MEYHGVVSDNVDMSTGAIVPHDLARDGPIRASPEMTVDPPDGKLHGKFQDALSGEDVPRSSCCPGVKFPPTGYQPALPMVRSSIAFQQYRKLLAPLPWCRGTSL